jgi:hypothetical protein
MLDRFYASLQKEEKRKMWKTMSSSWVLPNERSAGIDKTIRRARADATAAQNYTGKTAGRRLAAPRADPHRITKMLKTSPQYLAYPPELSFHPSPPHNIERWLGYRGQEGGYGLDEKTGQFQGDCAW